MLYSSMCNYVSVSGLVSCEGAVVDGFYFLRECVSERRRFNEYVPWQRTARNSGRWGVVVAKSGLIRPRKGVCNAIFDPLDMSDVLGPVGHFEQMVECHWVMP